MWKRRIALLAVLGLLSMLLALPASAGGTVDCGPSGHMYTRGWASSTDGQSHYRGANKAGPYQFTYYEHYWGVQVGTQTWDVKPDTATITSETAFCPI